MSHLNALTCIEHNHTLFITYQEVGISSKVYECHNFNSDYENKWKNIIIFF